MRANKTNLFLIYLLILQHNPSNLMMSYSTEPRNMWALLPMIKINVNRSSEQSSKRGKSKRGVRMEKNEKNCQIQNPWKFYFPLSSNYRWKRGGIDLSKCLNVLNPNVRISDSAKIQIFLFSNFRQNFLSKIRTI